MQSYTVMGRGRAIAAGTIAISFGSLGLSSAVGMVSTMPSPNVPAEAGETFRMFQLAGGASVLLASASLLGLGIGTVLGRRWARVWMVALSWLWLGLSALSVPMWLVSAAQLGMRGGESIVMSIVGAFVMLFFAAMPITFLALLGRASGKALFEELDPNPSWTDRRSPALLGLGTALSLLALGALAAALSNAGDADCRRATIGCALVALAAGATAVRLFTLRKKA